MAQHRAGDVHGGDPSQMPTDPLAVKADDDLLDLLGDLDSTPSQRELVNVMAAQRRAVHADSDKELIDADRALAAIPVDVGRPFAAGVTVLTVMLMIGATLGVVLAHVVTDHWLSVLLWGPALGVTCLLIAVGVVAYLGRRR